MIASFAVGAQLMEMRGFWREALAHLRPERALGRWITDLRDGDAILCWGKAAGATWTAIQRARALSRFQVLVVSPAPASRRPPRGVRWVTGEHPLPGPGSLRAGQAIREFLIRAGRADGRLTVFLSGGASSLAWLLRSGWTLKSLRAELARLSSRPWTIQRLNRARARLCLLKGGGAARLLAKGVRCRVVAISDVLPFGVEVVGSGPFAVRGILHPVAADNRELVRAFESAVRAGGGRLLASTAARTGRWETWARELAAQCRSLLRRGRAGYVVRGGEPLVDLTRGRGRGGRQCQLALALALALEPELRSGEACILCGSSDGRDGNSGAAGAVVGAGQWRRWDRSLGGPDKARKRLRSGVLTNDSAPWLAIAGALIPSFETGTNVQDLVALSLQPKRKTPGSRKKPGGIRDFLR